MSPCKHGLNQSWCAICNNSLRPAADPFRARRQDEKPHLFKGRDRVEWRGIGESLGDSGSERMQLAANASRVGRFRNFGPGEIAERSIAPDRTRADFLRLLVDVVNKG